MSVEAIVTGTLGALRMHVVLDTPAGGAADVELRLSTEDATVEDLLTAIGSGSGARGVLIDGRFCHLDLALTEIGLYEGAHVRPAGGATAGAADHAAPALGLRVIAGLDAGRELALSTTATTVGRDEECELSLLDDGVSRRHFTVAATPSGLRAIVTDLGSANGTWVDGERISEPAEIEPGTVVEAGDVAFTVAAPGAALPVDPVRQASAAGTIAFNRPPRVRSTGTAGPIEVPGEPGETQKARFSIASAVGPLLMGGVMVVLLHNIIYALFMLLSPILVLGNYLEQRRQNKRSSRGDAREFAQALDRFRIDVASRRAGARDRLRAAFPDLGEIVHRATAPDPRLWERRPDHDDFLHLSAGYGEVPFRPQVTDNWQSTEAAELILAENGWLESAPIDVDLSGGGVVGIVGDRGPSLALARALICQAAVLHGPADLTIAALAEDGAGEDWDWVKWLPHTRQSAGSGPRLAIGGGPATALAAELTEGDPDDPRTTLAVLDIPALIEGRGAAGRALLRAGDRVSGIVLARTAERLPAACTTVIGLDQEAGEAVLSRPQVGQQIDPLLVAGLSERTARQCAVALARFEDADLQIPGGSLPEFVALSGLIGVPSPDGAQIRSRWAATEHATDLVARFAVAEDGPLDVDLVGDGPHGLIAGTTGAGKSELLRSLVASLAVAHGPARVNFVLVDYKGGSAFAECAQLPHTVGMVTDLDEHLGERALRSLEAELRYRERVLREHRTADIIEHDRLVADGQVQALPRLVVIIDEFATLAAELPDFIASLVGIAQRGRSLGVHMILATQRPAGAVNENIRANTNLRICLRVQTAQDSTDVIDDPAAAKIPRTQPGRAQIRLGPSELVPVQTALVSGSSGNGPVSAVSVVPFAPGRHGAPAAARAGGAGAADGAGAGAGSDLARLVRAAGEAAAGSPPARRPWLEPLGEDVDLDWLLTLGPPRSIAGDPAPPTPVIGLGLADDPEAQAQYPLGWNLSAGNLLLYGIGGSGTTTALQSIALALARTTDPARVHVYVMDFGAGELSALGALPGVGAVTTAAEHERQSRLLRRLRGELAVRRSLDPAGRAAAPRIVLLLDGYAGFASEHADLAGDALREALARVWADGPELGIHTAIAADRLGAVPTALASLAQQRIAFQLADIADYAQFGLSRRAIPRFSPGRAVIGASGQVVQFARTRDASAVIEDLGGSAGTLPMAEGGPPPVEVLAESVPVQALLGGGRVSREPLFIPIGIGDETLEPVGFELYEGEHALVTGPPRTGRTTTLLVIAEVIAHLYPGVELAGIAVRRGSRLRDCPQLARVATAAEEIPDLVAQLRARERMQVLLIDDADATDDPSRALSELFSAGAVAGHVHAVIAGRADELRSLGHWSVGARRSRVGLLIQPDLQTDGMLLGVTLPRRPAPPARPGCGYRVDAGGFELMQVAVAGAGPGASELA